MPDVHVDDWEELYLDLSQLTDKELDVLARLVVRKLRTWMRQESDRSGNL